MINRPPRTNSVSRFLSLRRATLFPLRLVAAICSVNELFGRPT
jgi:hypothetical protein